MEGVCYLFHEGYRVVLRSFHGSMLNLPVVRFIYRHIWICCVAIVFNMRHNIFVTYYVLEQRSVKCCSSFWDCNVHYVQVIIFTTKTLKSQMVESPRLFSFFGWMAHPNFSLYFVFTVGYIVIAERYQLLMRKRRPLKRLVTCAIWCLYTKDCFRENLLCILFLPVCASILDTLESV